jgi:hypothetical protein
MSALVRLSIAVALALPLLGCNDDEARTTSLALTPSATGGGGTGGSGGSGSPGEGTGGNASSAGAAGDAGASGSGGDAGTGGAPIRTIETRSTFGKLDAAELLHDPDFELSGMDSLQYPWYGLEQSAIRTGSTCLSGLRCVALSPENYVAGSFVWPNADAVDVSFRARIPGPDCDTDAVGLVLPLDADAEPLYVRATEAAPVDGVCHYAANLPVPAKTGHHFWGFLIAARSKGTGDIIVDDASMRGGPVKTKSLSAVVPSADLVALGPSARARLKDRLPSSPRRPPSPVLNATGRKKKT